MVVSSLKSKAWKETRKGMKRAKKITVDVANRMQRSFGKPIGQMVEIHYQGRPMTFRYNGPVEVLSIDVLHREEQEQLLQDGKEIKEAVGVPKKEPIEQFDITKRRLDTAFIAVSCSCGIKFKTTVPVPVARLGNERIKKAITDPDIRKHVKDGHTIQVDYVEIRDETVPENNRIKDFNPKKVNFYRLFPKKTAEVRYLVSYDQDILSEAPQVKFADTSTGSTILRKQNMFLMIFLFGVMEMFTYIFASSQAYSVVPVNNTPWYIVVFTIITAIVAVWWVRIHEMSKTTIKLISLQAAPFYISNRGIIPVVMTNSVLNQVWDYQSSMMQTTAKDARDVYHSLTTWSDSQIAELYRAKLLGQVEHELTIIQTEIRDIQKLDYEYRNQTTNQNATTQQMVLVGIGVFAIYTVILLLLGVL